MSAIASLLLIIGGVALICFGSIGLLFTLGGQPPDAGAIGFTGGCAGLGLILVGAGLYRLLWP